MLFPKKVKFRKWHRMRKNPKKKQVATRGTYLAFGNYGVKADGSGEISSNQIESSRRVLTRYVQKTGKMWIRIFPDKPITKRPPEVTMGGGKGDPAGYVVEIKTGRVLFEIDGVEESVAREAFRKVGAKLPIKIKFIARK